MSEQTEAKAVVPYTAQLQNPAPLDFRDIRKNTQLVQQAIAEVMKEGTDYGRIPGCAEKGLYKPGAEKLFMLFKLAAFPEVIDKSEPGVARFIVRTKVVHIPTGLEVGVGVGSCSSDEMKYKWRAAVHPKEWAATQEDQRRIHFKAIWKDGKKTDDVEEIQQVKTNPADIENTILKMASKRSKVDAALQVCAASDLLKQGEDEIVIDIEEAREPLKKPKARGPKKEAPATGGQAEHAGSDFAEITSKYDGSCKGCSGSIKKGDKILYSKTKGTFHSLDCVNAPVSA